jgi:hypothetical protein
LKGSSRSGAGNLDRRLRERTTPLTVLSRGF